MNDLSTITKIKLLAALQETAPPCDAFECKYWQDCKEKMLACKAFAHYVDTGRVVNPMASNPPTRAQYKKIYRHDAI